MRPLVALVLLALGSSTSAQFQVLLTEDFEDGLQGWSFDDPAGQAPSTPLWHLAESGECGVTLTRMAAYSLPEPACTYATGQDFVVSRIRTEPFVLTGEEPFHIELDGLWDFDPGPPGAAASNPYLQDAVTGAVISFAVMQLQFKQQPGKLVRGEFDFFVSDFWDPSHPVRLGLEAFTINQQSSAGTGMRWDNVEVRSSAYRRFGTGVPGYAASESPTTPSLWGYGELTPGSENRLQLFSRPNTIAALVFGLQLANLPFKGGVMYPAPSRVWLVPTPDAIFPFNAVTYVPFTLPDFPAGQTLEFQFWVVDPDAAQGWAASNGLEGVTS